MEFKIKKQGRGAKTLEKKSPAIMKFISRRFEFLYIPAIRDSQLSVQVVTSLLERELEALESNPEYQAAIDTIEKLQRPIFEQMASDVHKHLKGLLPSVNAVEISPESRMDRPGPKVRLPQLIIDDGTPTDLDAKGDGIKSLAAIALMRATRAGNSAGDLVVAIEEPESHLHPGAIRQLATVLREIAKEHQVIITTHSPLLVARNRSEANIIVNKSKATPAKNIKVVRESLGVRVHDNLQSAEYVIVVEGKTDIIILTAIFCHLSVTLADLVDEGRIAFDQLEGAGNIVYKVSLLRNQVTTPIIILDDDSAGRVSGKKAENEGGIDKRFIFYCKRPRASESELEDLLNQECYLDLVRRKHGVTIDQLAFQELPGKWSARMKETFEISGKSWSSQVEQQVKQTVAESVKSNPQIAVSPKSMTLLNSICCAIENIVSGSD
jgi:putative ATP-dependent endonuclease of the OLD family